MVCVYLVGDLFVILLLIELVRSKTRRRLQSDTFRNEVFERSRYKSSPLEKPRSKLANPVELTV